MVGYTRDRGRDFWYDFDNKTLFKRLPAISRAVLDGYRPLPGFATRGLDILPDFFRASFHSSNHPAEFSDRLNMSGDAFVRLADAQWEIMRQHFQDEDDLTLAFIDFGQGTLFDDREPREVGNEVHTMDGSPDDWVGYHRWHAAIRAAMMTGGEEALWLRILRRVALAWAIQTEANPAHDSNHNQGLPQSRVDALASYWLNADVEEIDRDFATFLNRAPRRTASGITFMKVEMADVETPTHYARVTEILEAAAGDGRPSHSGLKRFWTLPLEDFLKIERKIRNIELIASVGSDRGMRSGLVHALRGINEFDENGMGQMPRDRPPVSDADIAYVSRWIDEGCPE